MKRERELRKRAVPVSKLLRSTLPVPQPQPEPEPGLASSWLLQLVIDCLCHFCFSQLQSRSQSQLTATLTLLPLRERNARVVYSNSQMLLSFFPYGNSRQLEVHRLRYAICNSVQLVCAQVTVGCK